MTQEFPTSPALNNPGTTDPSLVASLPTGVGYEKQQRLDAAEHWLGTQTTETIGYRDVVAQATADGEPIPAVFEQTEPVPVDFASEIALLAQQRLGVWEKHDLFPDVLGDGLERIRNQAIVTATELDFGVVAATLPRDWPVRVRLNAMHKKFKDVSPEAISDYLGDDIRSEYRALFIRNIIADHAPELLTPDLTILVDPSQPQWRISSAHAEILFRNRKKPRLDTYLVNQLPIQAPSGNGAEYTSHDQAAMKTVQDMDDAELAGYVEPASVTDIRERGSILFKELTAKTQEALLTRRFYEIGSKSSDPTLQQTASDRNMALEHDPLLLEGDYVHATYTPQILEQILKHGLQCGEAVTDNTRAQINHPFTVSFLKVTQEISDKPSMPDRLSALKNQAYGPLNIVLQRDSQSTDFETAQKNGSSYQHNIFGGVPSTEIKSIIIRDETAQEDTTEGVISTIVKHGMFIPVYKGSTGELILSSKDFEARRRTPSKIGKLALTESPS